MSLRRELLEENVPTDCSCKTFGTLVKNSISDLL